MTRTILQRLQVLADQRPSDQLAVASSFFRALKGGANRDPIEVMVSVTQKLQEIPDDRREAVLALAELLNEPVQAPQE